MSPIRVLYVDDSPLDRDLVRDALEADTAEFELVTTATGAEFHARLAEGEYDIVLTDFNILGFDGLQVVDTVRAHHARLPVVIVTGTGSEEVAVAALKRGVADYVIKTPSHIRRLPQVIHAVLEMCRLDEEHRQAEVALSRSHAALRALASHWQSAIEAERAQIAREIHDDLGQSMTALKMDLAWLASRLPDDDECRQRLRGMDRLVDDSISFMRRIATQLRPQILDDLGLNAALEWQAGEFSRRAGIPCQVSLPAHGLDLDPALNTSLFRIFQEALTNAARHARATRVDASLRRDGPSVVLTVQDDGRGITASEINDPRSLGLLGLRERAIRWNGSLDLHGAPGEGTTITVRIPVGPA